MVGLKSLKLKLFIPAAGAAATPPLGPILGQFGINTVQFCKEFNELTDGFTFFFDEFSQSDVFDDILLSVDIFINEDRTYSFNINKPPVSYLLRLFANVRTGAPQQVVASITVEHLIFIALFKFPSLPLRAACKIVKGTARSIGINILL